MNDIPSIQWFPGHMTKTRRMMEKCLPLVDGVVEILDARIPVSSGNPDIRNITAGKPRIVVMNKCDAANEKINARWVRYFKDMGIKALPADCRSGRGLNAFVPAVKEVLTDVIEKNTRKGMSGRVLHLMVVGVPNVGKSSFINRMAGRKKAKVEDRPGVTRDKQWVMLEEDIELLDMPGVLWPKFDDMAVGEKLAFTGAVKDTVTDVELLGCRLLLKLRDIAPENIKSRYNISLDTPEEDEAMASGETMGCLSGYELLTRVGKARGMLISGGEIDTGRAAAAVLDEFRGGKLGRISLECPEDCSGESEEKEGEVL
ncbi:MAG: ribosome biogenesis GTPase YlqF [Oscillospiraceae bacterium]|nr:ribosome biogenesis GTPase YlqF [Oscillospiraceae bacterium]